MLTTVELLKALSEPRSRRLTEGTWVAAAAIAGLRVAANDSIRARDRDRGTAKNQLADLWGVFGELVVLRRLADLTPSTVVHQPIDWESSVDEVDLKVPAEPDAVLLEVKAHFVEPGKKWFLINARAHERSRNRGAAGYVPVVTALGADRAYVGALLDVAVVERWDPPRLSLRDPAIGTSLDTVARVSYQRTWRELTHELEPEKIASQALLEQVMSEASHDFAAWRELLPSLQSMPAREVVDTVLSTREQIARDRR